MGCVVYLYLTGFWQAGGGANGRRVTWSGWVGAKQVVEGAGIQVQVRVGSVWCNRRMPPLPEFVQQRLPGSAVVETPISDPICMHYVCVRAFPTKPQTSFMFCYLCL